MALTIHDQSVDLINELDRAFPARCIGRNETPESAHRYAGKRELIEDLKTHLKRSTERPGEIPSVLSKRSHANHIDA